MKKFLAVVKREYVQRVRTRFFVVVTVFGPVMMVLFTVVPGLILSKAGGPTRLAVVDETGKMYERLSDELARSDNESAEAASRSMADPVKLSSNSNNRINEAGRMIHGNYEVEEIKRGDQTMAEVERSLDQRVAQKKLDGYLVLPKDLLAGGRPEFHVRNAADPFASEHIQDCVSRAVRAERLREAGIDEGRVQEMFARASVITRRVGGSGEESKSNQNFYLVFGMGLAIYASILLYGQVVLGAVIEEKQTRIAEILFSSMRSFPLMVGKLIGVSLVALTQLGIWALALLALATWGVASLASHGVQVTVQVEPIVLLYFVLYFLLGYGLYATLYALIGSIVTTAQEGGQLAMPVVLMLVAGFYFAFPIIRSPNSSLAVWSSMVPFFAPVTMLVRIVTERPPFWQIALSLAIGAATMIALVWMASRIYRVGMLMHGKKASIPEVWRWLRQV